VTVGLGALVFVATAVYRFNLLGGQLGGLENDEFLGISRATAMLRGELPSRDFVDFGAPLSYVATAAAMWASEGTLLGHVVLSVLMLAAGAALTYYIGWRASGSHVVALAAAVVQLALGPRLYSYPKIVLYALAVLGWWRYARKPAPATLVALSVLTATAFLFRHDHGVYIGVGTAVLLAVSSRDAGFSNSVRAFALYGAVAAACLAPYLVFLQVNVGVLEHLRLGMEISRVDRNRTQLRRPAFTFDLGRPLIEVVETAPLPPPRIKVRWQQPVPPGARETFASTYKVRPHGSSSGDGGEFELTDESPELLRRLAADPLVADTQNIDRRAWRVVERPEADAWTKATEAVPLLRTRLAPGVLRSENAVPFVYYLFLALPFAAAAACLAAVLRHGDAAAWREVCRLAPIIVVMALLNGWFLRGTLPIRLADVSVLAAALGAWLIAAATSAVCRRGWAVRVVVAALLVGVVVTTLGSAMSIGVFIPNLRTASDGRGPAGVGGRAREIAQLLRTPGPEFAARSAATSPLMRLADYLHGCMRPDDRLLVVAYMPQLFYFADRPFAAGHVDVRAGYLVDERDQRAAVARLERQSVPLVVTEPRTVFETRYRAQSPLLLAYLDRVYADAGDHDFGGESFRILVKKDEIRRRTSRDGLPCFP